MRGFAPRVVCLGISVTDSHQTSDFCECPTTIYVQRHYRFSVRNFSHVPGKPETAFSTFLNGSGSCGVPCHKTSVMLMPAAWTYHDPVRTMIVLMVSVP